MKRYNSFAAIAASCLAMVSCQSKIDVERIDHNFTLSIIPNETKTVLNSNSVSWSENEGMYLKFGEIVSSAIYSGSQFSASVGSITAGNYSVEGWVPNIASLAIPTNQTSKPTTFDPKADILVASAQNIAISDADISAGTKTINFNFARIGAICKFSLPDNLNNEYLVEGEKLYKVIISSTTKNLAGTFSISNQTVTGFNSNSVVVTLESPTLLKGATFYSVLAPLSFSNGDNLTFTFITDQHKIVKTISFSSSVSLYNTKLNEVTLSVSTATVTSAWEKVTSTSITDGRYIIVTYDDTHYLPTTASSTNPTVTPVSFSNNMISVSESMMWDITVSSNNVLNVKSASNNAVYLWGGSANDGVRVNSSSSKAGATNEWYVKNTASYGVVLYNKATTSDRYLTTYGTTDWRNYTSSSTTNKAANLYKWIANATGTASAGDTGAGDTGSGDTGSGDTGAGDTGAGDTGSGDTGSYSIVFSNTVKTASGLTSTTKASTTIHTDSRSYVSATPYTVNSGNCYYGDDTSSIRVGKSGASASLSIELSSAGTKKAKKIVVNCLATGQSNVGTLSVNGATAKETSTEATDLSFTFDGKSEISTITLSTTKATKIKSITVTY